MRLTTRRAIRASASARAALQDSAATRLPRTARWDSIPPAAKTKWGCVNSVSTKGPALPMAQKQRTVNAPIFSRGSSVKPPPVPRTTAPMVETVLLQAQHTRVPAPVDLWGIDAKLIRTTVLQDTANTVEYVWRDRALLSTATV